MLCPSISNQTKLKERLMLLVHSLRSGHGKRKGLFSWLGLKGNPSPTKNEEEKKAPLANRVPIPPNDSPPAWVKVAFTAITRPVASLASLAREFCCCRWGQFGGSERAAPGICGFLLVGLLLGILHRLVFRFLFLLLGRGGRFCWALFPFSLGGCWRTP